MSANIIDRQRKIESSPKAVPKKQNLDQNIYDSKSHIWSSFLKYIIFGIQLYKKKSITRSLIIFKKPRKMASNFLITIYSPTHSNERQSTF